MEPGTHGPVAERARRRIAARLIPYLFLLYIIAYLDRVNVAYAALGMQGDLKFSDQVFGLGAGIFFLGYFLLEIPGALIVERWSARKWIARIMVTWGLVTVLIALVRTPAQFYGARFLLGAAEAGFFPGIIVYLTHWFRYEDRAKAVALFMSAIPISNILGSPVAGLLLSVNWFGLSGWRWLFILEGIPAVLLGVVTIFFLTDRPAEAGWLPADEREWITRELERERAAKLARQHYTVWQALRHRDVILLALIYFLALTGHYGFNLWLPTILKRSSSYSDMTITLLAAIPYLAALGAMLWNGWHSDRTRERRWHSALPLFVTGVAFALAVASGNRFWIALALFTVAGAAVHSLFPVFWSLPTLILTQSAAAASIGFINSVGNLGGFAGPYAIGYLRTHTGSFVSGLLYLVVSLLLGGVLVLLLRVHRHALPGRPSTAGVRQP